jgi:hypothetical protein
MHSDVLKYDGSLPEPPYTTAEDAECEECARLSDENEQLRKLAQDAYAAWDSDQETKVGKLLRAMLDANFRKTYRPDLVTPNA